MNDQSNPGNNESQQQSKKHKIQHSIVASFLHITPASKTPMVIALTTTGIKYLQLMMFSFLPQFDIYWSNKRFIEGMNTFFDYFHFSRVLRQNSWELYIISFYLILSFLILFIVSSLSIYFRTTSHKSQFGAAVVYSSLAWRLLIYLLFLPVTDLLLSINECSSNSSGSLTMVRFPSIKCFQGFHLASSILGIIVAALYLPLVICYSFLFFEPMMTKGAPYHRY